MKKLTKNHIKEISILIFKYILLTGLAFIILYPIIIKFSAAFMSVEDTRDVTVRFIPKTFTLKNFVLVAQNIDYFPNLIKTIFFVITVSAVQVFVAMLTAYGLACFKFPGHKVLFSLVLATLIIPPHAITLPLFLNFRTFDILGIFQLFTGDTVSIVGTSIPIYLMATMGVGLKNGLLVFIFRQFFLNFPKELEESASIDGAGVYKTFIKIALPSALPMLLTCFLFSIVWYWTDVYYTTIFIPDNTFLASEMLEFAGSLGNVVEGLAGEGKYSISLQNNAGILLFIAPITILYFVCQRYFVESIERTGLVG